MPVQQKKSKMEVDKYQNLFLGGLKPNISHKCIKNYFSKYGEITEINMKMDKLKGTNKGFAFVCFKDDESIKEVLNHSHYLDGRKIECKVSLGGEYNLQDRYKSAKCRIFVKK